MKVTRLADHPRPTFGPGQQSPGSTHTRSRNGDRQDQKFIDAGNLAEANTLDIPLSISSRNRPASYNHLLLIQQRLK